MEVYCFCIWPDLEYVSRVGNQGASQERVKRKAECKVEKNKDKVEAMRANWNLQWQTATCICLSVHDTPKLQCHAEGAGVFAAKVHICPAQDSDNLRQGNQQELQKPRASWWSTCTQPAQSLMPCTHLPSAMGAASLLPSKSQGNFSVANFNPEPR